MKKKTCNKRKRLKVYDCNIKKVSTNWINQRCIIFGFDWDSPGTCTLYIFISGIGGRNRAGGGRRGERLEDFGCVAINLPEPLITLFNIPMVPPPSPSPPPSLAVIVPLHTLFGTTDLPFIPPENYVIPQNPSSFPLSPLPPPPPRY